MPITLGDVGVTILTVSINALLRLGNYLPQFIGGLIVLFIGLIVASVLKATVLRLFQWLKIEQWFEKAGIRLTRPSAWPQILAELVRWSVVILFLIPTVEAWGLPKATEVINQFLLYLPNVLVAVVIAFVGLVAAGLTADIVKNAAQGLGSNQVNILATTARYAIVFFTALVVLDQLGVAAELVRILFTGIVAMLAIAGGLAFGLGGQDSARRALNDFLKRVSETEERVTRERARGR